MLTFHIIPQKEGALQIFRDIKLVLVPDTLCTMFLFVL